MDEKYAIATCTFKVLWHVNTFGSSLEKRFGAALNLLSRNHLRLLLVDPKCVTGPAGQLSAKLEFAFMR